MVPQRVRAEKGVGPFLPTRVAPLFGSRGVAKLVRSTAALRGDGDPATPSSLRLAPCDLPKIGSNVAYVSFFNTLLGRQLLASGRQQSLARTGRFVAHLNFPSKSPKAAQTASQAGNHHLDSTPVLSTARLTGQTISSGNVDLSR